MVQAMADIGGAISAFRRNLEPGAERRALDRIATEPLQQRAMDQFRRAVDRAPDVKAAIRDPRVLQVIATALGIPDAAQQPGLALRALLSDPADPKSLVNRLPDRRWKAAAEALNLAAKGVGALRDPTVQERLAEGMRRARWRDDLEAQQPGLGDALLFRERAGAVDNNIFQVLGDPILRRVVTGALGLPRAIAVQSIETQARAVQSRLKLEKLEDPKEVQKLAERYLMNRATSEGGSSGMSPLAMLGFRSGGFSV